MRAVLALLLLLLSPFAAWGQVPGGVFTPGHALMAVTPSGSPYTDAGGASGSALPGQGYLTEIGITNTGAPFCINDALTNAPGGYHQLCFGANALGGGLISYQAMAGAASLPLQFNINGTIYPFPSGGGGISGPTLSTLNEPAIWANTSGTLLADGLGAAIFHAGTFSVGTASQYVFTDHSNVDFYQTNSLGTLKLAAGLNGGFASNTAGHECGDIDFSIYVSGAPVILAFNGCVGGHPALTPSVGDVINIGGYGQAILNLFVDEILDESSNILVNPTNYVGGVPQNFNLMVGRLTGTNSNALAAFDAAGNQVANFNSIGTAVNYLEFLARATGIGPSIVALGSDTNININLAPKGTGAVHVLSAPLQVDGVASFATTASFAAPFDLFGSSTGFTAISSLNASASNYSIAFPAESGTVMLRGDALGNAIGTSLVLGSPTGGGEGVGTLNATGIFINGVPLSTTSTITVGTTAVASATANAILYVNGTSLGNLPTTNNGVLGAGGTGIPAFSTTLPSGLAASSMTLTSATVLTSFTATGLVTNADLVNAATTVNGTTCTLGSTCSVSATATSMTVGATTVLSGTSNAILYNNAGTLGNIVTTNNGVMSANSGGVPSFSTTLPSGLAASNMSLTAPTILTSFTATGLVTNADLVNAATTVNGQTCTLGSTCTITASATSIAVGTTGVTGGTGGYMLYNNSGTLGNSALGTGVLTLLGGSASGSGGPAGTTSPVFVTPTLGVATATSINTLAVAAIRAATATITHSVYGGL
jgi:hypothetical protein